MAAGGAAVYHAGKNRGADQEAAAQDAASPSEQQAAPPPPPAPVAPAPGGMAQSSIDELKQLGQLHDQGVLTDEEFAAQKAKVLNG